MTQTNSSPIRVAVLGAGGLGKAAARIIGMKRELLLTCICDSKGIVSSPAGLDTKMVASVSGDLVTSYCKAAELAEEESAGGVSVAASINTVTCEDPIKAMMDLCEGIDAVLIALPNLPNEFIPGVVARFMEAKHSLVFVDVLKRTRAVDCMFALDHIVREARGVVLTGCGATPGFLAASAVLAAQSFVEIEKVDIWWGVGIANWDSYRATVREDIAHLPGFTLERARAMSDKEVEELLAQNQGLLELRHMEHADDLLLKRAGVVDNAEQVEVGGILDTRHAKKPVSTTMTLTGLTFDGKRASHKFVLGDETTMAANVIGPALGYLKRGMWLKKNKIFGVFGSTEFLPMVVR